MNEATLGIPIAFLILAGILLWSVIFSRGWWWAKAAAIAVTLYFSIALWGSTTTYLGWPTPDEVPNKFLVHWAVVQEPSKTTDSPGGIFIWLKDLGQLQKSSDFTLDYKAIVKKPRAYELPYSRQLHQQVSDMLKGIKKGKRYMGGKAGIGEGKGKGPPGKGKGKGGGKNGGSFSNSPELYFGELPPPKMPQKVLE